MHFFEAQPREGVSHRFSPGALERMQWFETALRNDERQSFHAYHSAFGLTDGRFHQDIRTFIDRINVWGGEAEKIRGWLRVNEWPEGNAFGTLHIDDWLRRAPNVFEHLEVQQIDEADRHVMNALRSAASSNVVLRISGKRGSEILPSALFSPHHIVRAVGRNYVRGFFHHRNQFETVSASEIVSAERDERTTFQNDEHDQDWHSRVEIKVSLSRTLDIEEAHRLRSALGLPQVRSTLSLSGRACFRDQLLQSIGITPGIVHTGVRIETMEIES